MSRVRCSDIDASYPGSFSSSAENIKFIIRIQFATSRIAEPRNFYSFIYTYISHDFFLRELARGNTDRQYYSLPARRARVGINGVCVSTLAHCYN